MDTPYLKARVLCGALNVTQFHLLRSQSRALFYITFFKQVKTFTVNHNPLGNRTTAFYGLWKQIKKISAYIFFIWYRR